MTTELVPAQINYAVVELLHKNADINTKPELGLFRGLRLRTEKQQTTEAQTKIGLLNLILLGQTGQNNTLNGFSHDFYKVMSIRLGYGTTKEFLIFKQSEDEQKQAVEILGAILESLRLDKKMLENDSEIVDLDKYKDLPYDLEKATATTNTTHMGVGGVYNNYGNRNVSTAGTDWEKKRKEEEAEKARQEKLRYTPYLIKRVGDLPTSQTIQAMKKKVMDLVPGEYKAAPLPIVKEKTTQADGTDADADDKFTTKTAPPPPPTVYQGE
jgi:hypothetical protein